MERIMPGGGIMALIWQSEVKSSRRSGLAAASALAIVLGSLAIACGCGHPEGPCGPDTELSSGQYRVERVQNYSGSDDDSGPLGGGNRHAVFDLEAGTMTVTFEVDGQQVEQIWSFNPSSVAPIIY